jgi:hypothetical protein
MVDEIPPGSHNFADVVDNDRGRGDLIDATGRTPSPGRRSIRARRGAACERRIVAMVSSSGRP